MPDALWLKDTGSVPGEGWSYHVATTNYTVCAPNYNALLAAVFAHCAANNVEQPSKAEIDLWICENLTVECFQGKQPLVNNFLIRNPRVVQSCCGSNA